MAFAAGGDSGDRACHLECIEKLWSRLCRGMTLSLEPIEACSSRSCPQVELPSRVQQGPTATRGAKFHCNASALIPFFLIFVHAQRYNCSSYVLRFGTKAPKNQVLITKGNFMPEVNCSHNQCNMLPWSCKTQLIWHPTPQWKRRISLSRCQRPRHDPRSPV